MDSLPLHASSREVTGKKVKQLRAEGVIPAVMYGYGQDNTSIQLDALEFNRVYRKGGDTTILNLTIEEGVEVPVLVHDMDVDPVTGDVWHVDFFAVNMSEKIEAEVPLVFEGTSAAVKDEGGTLVKAANEVTVECLPNDIPSEIVVDISSLATFDDVISAGDLNIPEGVELQMDADDAIASVEAPRSEEELDALSEDVVEDVEGVEGVVKEEEDDAEGEASAEGDDAKKDSEE